MEHTREAALAWLKKESRKTWRHYYRQLDEDARKCYEAIYYGLLRLDTDIPLPVSDGAAAQKALHACLIDNPLFFWTGAISFAYSPAGTYVRIGFSMNIQEIIDTVFRMRKEILRFRKAHKGKSEEEILQAVHSFITDNVTYDSESPLAIHEAPTVLINHTGVCDGIAKAAKILLDDCHVYCAVIHGTGGTPGHTDGHAWNLARIGNHFYHFDFTFDNTLTAGSPDHHYDYFALSDKQIRKDHAFDPIGEHASHTNDWHRQRNCYFTSKQKLRDHIASCVQSHTPVFSFRLPYTKNALRTRDIIMDLLREEMNRLLPPGSTWEISFNEQQMVMTVITCTTGRKQNTFPVPG